MIAGAQTQPPARVQVVAQEFRYSLSRSTVRAGHVIVELVNRGQDTHDLDLRRVGGTHIFRFPSVQPGQVVDRELKLVPGRYVLWCAVAGHRERGMRAVLRVVRPKQRAGSPRHRHSMFAMSSVVARISYDEETAAAYRAVREIPREGLAEWREAIRRHLEPSPRTTVLDIGAGTGQFSAAFHDWFDIEVVAVEPSAAMRAQIPSSEAIRVLEGDASTLPLPPASTDAAWLSLVLHHVADLDAAAHEIRRVLRPGAPILVRQGFPGRLDEVELVRWFPETARAVETYPSIADVCAAFGAAGFRMEALERVRETYPTSLADFLGELDTLRHADTTLRGLTEDEFLRGKERVRRAAREDHEPRSNGLDLLVLR